MGITVGKPLGPIPMPDFAGNILKYKEIDLKKKQLELMEKEKKAKAGTATKPQISDKDPKFHQQFDPVYDRIMSDIDSYYAQYADELNPNNTADDDIPGIFDPKKLRYVKTMEKNAMEFASHSVTYMSAGDDLFELLDSKTEDGLSFKIPRDQIKQHPVYITKEALLEEMNLYPGYSMNYFSPLWEGNENEGGIIQKPKIKEGGDFNNPDDWVVNENGHFVDINGKPLIAHGAYGKMKLSGNFLVSDIYNQTVTSDAINWDQNGNILYGGKNYYDYFDINFFDKNKYASQKQINFTQELANNIEYTNLLTLQRDGKSYRVEKGAFENIRTQAIQNFAFKTETNSWGSNYSVGAAREIAGNVLRDLNMAVNEANINSMVEKIKAGGALPEGLYGAKSPYDNYELKTFNDYAGEMILKAYDSRTNFTKRRNKSNVSITVKKDKEAKEMDYRWSSMSINDYAYTADGPSYQMGYGTPAQTDVVNKKLRWRGHGNIRSGSNEALWNQVGFLTIDPILTKSLTNAQGTYNASQIEMVPMNRKTGKIIRGEWDASGQTFTAYNKSDAENCIIVPCFQGYFKPDDENAIRSTIKTNNSNVDNQTLNEWLGGDDGVQTFIPIHRVFPPKKGERHYEEYFNMADGIMLNNIYYKSGGNKIDVTPGSTSWKLPGS